MRAAALTSIVALALVGCGSDEPSQPDAATTAQTAAETPSGTERRPLTRSQYDQIERLYRASVRAEATEDEQFRGATRIVRRACAQVDDGDRLLAAVVEGCEQSMTAILEILQEDCDDPGACARAMREGARVARQAVDVAGRANRTIAAMVGPERCRDALITPDAFNDALETLAGALDDGAAAIENEDPEDFEAAQRSLERSQAGFDALPSAKQQLKRFRSACAPSA